MPMAARTALMRIQHIRAQHPVQHCPETGRFERSLLSRAILNRH